MAAYNEDEDFTSSSGGATPNANLQQALQAGKRQHTFGGKARIYKRAPGKRHFKPEVGALKEIAFYQWEYGLLCSKIASACLFREICQDFKTDLH